MKRKLEYPLVASLLCVSLALASCGNGAKRELNKLLLEVAEGDATVDSGDWAKTTDSLDKNKSRFKS